VKTIPAGLFEKIVELRDSAEPGRLARRPRRTARKKSAAPRLAPGVARTLAGAARRLAVEPPEMRPELIGQILAWFDPAHVEEFLNATVRLYLGSADAAAGTPYADVLADFGGAAGTAVFLGILKAKAGWQQAALADGLGRLGPTLSGGECFDLARFLRIAACHVTESEAVAAVALALAAVVPPVEPDVAFDIEP
jgi:hypothetical protein